MQLSGHLSAFPVSNLIQWATTERVSGILVVSAGPGYRIRFSEGRLVSAACWRPRFQLESLLARRRQLDMQKLEAWRAQARERDLPLALVLAEARAVADLQEILRALTAEVVYSLLRETAGTFFFGAADEPLPETLRSPMDSIGLLFEGVRLLDEEAKLTDVRLGTEVRIERLRMPAVPGSIQEPLAPKLLWLLDEPRTVDFLLENVPADPNVTRLTLAKLVHDGIVAAHPVEAAPETQALEASAIARRIPRRLRPPSPEERLFLLCDEARLLQQADGALNLLELARKIGIPEGGIVSILHRLRGFALIELQPAPRRTKVKLLVLAAVLLVAAPALVLLAGRVTPELDGYRAVATPRQPELQATPDPDLEARDSAVRQAYEALAVGDLQSAGHAAAQAQALDPEAPAVRELAANLEAAFAARTKAQDVEAKQKEAQAREHQSLLADARRALKARRSEEALRLLGKAAALMPGDPEVGRLVLQAREAEPVTRAQALPTPAAATPLPALPTPVPQASAPQEPPAPAPRQPVRLGDLIVNAVPYGNVRINSAEMGVTPLRVTLPLGSYQIEVYRDGYQTQRRTAELQGDQKHVEAFTLRPEEDPDP